jgi:uncharacterized repeat protein (TIGR01451 family)
MNTLDYFQFFPLFFSGSKKNPSNECYVVKGKCKRTTIGYTRSLVNGLIILLVTLILPFQGVGQTNPNEATWSGSGYSIKKVVSNTTIASGVNFSYTIIFTAPAGATTVSIQDAIPSNLVVVSIPTPALVNGVTPVVVTTGAIGSQVVTYSLTSLPATSASSGSFTIVVKFPEGTTCNGAGARNRVGIMVNGKWEYTEFVSTTATAVDPWVVSKSILSGPVVNPNGGNCGYMMPAGDTVTYRLSVMKNSPYYGNVIGQQNMSSAVVSDVLPAGAIMLTSTCGIPANSTGTITWQPNAGNLDAANPWAYYWCDITVYYPSGSFPNGSFVYNLTTLTGTMCSQQVSHTSNQTCIEIGNVVPNPNGYFQKYVYLTNRVPGCTGFYTVLFYNNGNVPLSAFEINDVIPTGITVNKVQVYGGSPTTTINLTANAGAMILAPSITTSFFDSGPVSGISNLKLKMTGSLPVGSYIYLYVYFTVNPNPTGTVVTNCSTFNGLANALTLPQTCASFTVDAGQPKPCILKDICSPKASYNPGDTLRFRLRIQNIGSASITGASFKDTLNSNFTYIGNESYYVANSYNPNCSSGSGIPVGTTAWSGVTTGHSGNNLSWSLPVIPSDCQAFYVGYCGYYGTWGLPYYYIDFDVKVSNSALPGVTPNKYTVKGGNLTSPETSNTVNVLVVASFGQEVQKQVSTNNGVTFASSGTVTPGGSARYRLNYKNTSNVPVSTVNLVDLLPRDDGTNDWLILNRSVARGSQFDVLYNANHSTLPVAAASFRVMNFAPGLNICLPPFGINAGCTTTTWGVTPTQNIRANYGTYVLNSNVTLMEDFDVNIPANATSQQHACNDFAAISTAQFLLNGVPQTVALTPIAAPPICITIDTAATTRSCCDSVHVTQVYNPVAATCCARIVTDCVVKSINVTVTNGTIASTSWNCGNLPNNYIGQSSYTFAPSCALDMTNCITPTQAGIVTVTYIINFQNGGNCEKMIDLNCGVPAINCCDSLIVKRVPGANGVLGCCAGLKSKCDVDSVNVKVTNGTINSASWNCGVLPSGYIGQSNYTFNANNCAVTMTTCIDPIQTGIVTVTYTAYFHNGEKCTKLVDLDCTAPLINCCDSVTVSVLNDAAGHPTCCARIVSKCPVDSISVHINNGTISSTSWNCGNLPTGYSGQSSFMFNANLCAIDMITCADADQTGFVTVNYVIYFHDGKTCEKSIRLDCVAPVNCCDSVSVVNVSNTGGLVGCCAKLVTTCEVKSINISVNNGTISSTSWNCGTLPAGFVGQSNFTFAPNGCTVNMTNCFIPLQSGVVTVTYLINFQNGDRCEKTIKLECKPDQNCCDKVKLERLVNADGTLSCCAKLSTSCEVKSVNVSVSNGMISSTGWNCGTLPTGFLGQSNFTFNGNGCILTMTNCFDAIQSGVVTVTYTINFQNGETCKKEIKLECKANPSDCCALVDFKLKQKWPFLSTQVGTFSITNLDPTSPICSVAISATPSGTFTPGVLIVDGANSSQTWNSSSIPASGNLTPSAVNSIVFSMVGNNYHGKITICIVKCDGTTCCFDFKWNPKIILGVDISLEQLPVSGKLVAVTVNPVVTTSTDEKVKYVAFGLRDAVEIRELHPEFYAISATGNEGDEYPAGLAAPIAAYMGTNNVFFELSQPKGTGEKLGAFNLVFKNILPKLGCTLFNSEGDIIFSGNINVSLTDTVKTSVIEPVNKSGNMFEFIKLYPNPSNGSFHVTYATGNQRDVEIRVINPLGQVVRIIQTGNNMPGIHDVNVNVEAFSDGLYKVALYSGGEVLNKSAILKQ